MFKTTNTYIVSKDTYIDKIFMNGLPANAFINKGRCAIGATKLEINNPFRCSIIAVPNISILISKKDSGADINIVYGDISQEMVNDMLAVYKPGQKIMTTPEGTSKIINAAIRHGRLEELHREWFLLLDECHTFISESYRPGILKPFDFFWDFDNKTILSATPYMFSDPEFYKLHYYEIKFTSSLETVHLINAASVTATLDYIIRNAEAFPGNLHINLNSVTGIKAAILRSGIQDCNIFCANDKDGANMKKLGDLEKWYVAEPKEGMYKKINFYTCKYFEGWDMYDDNATIILVTDVHNPHTKVGVGSKGKQAVGRLRSAAHKIYHITNHQYNKSMKTLETFKEEYLHVATLLIKQNNEYVANCNEQGIKPVEDKRIIKFADINKTTKIATLNLMKLDQQINEAANNEIYNHISYIKKDWEDAYFDVEQDYSDITLVTTTTVKRKSASTQLQEDYQKLLYLKTREKGAYIFTIGKSPEQQIMQSNPTAYKAFKLLDEKTMIALKYNVKKVQAAIILKENDLAEVKVLKLLNQTFKAESKYSNEQIKSKLQAIYEEVGIRTENGKIKVATAAQLGDLGRFEIKDCKITTSKGKVVNGQFIERAQFSLRMVA